MLCVLAAGCAVPSSSAEPRQPREPRAPRTGRAPAPSPAASEPTPRALTRQEAQRLARLMTPLVRAMNSPRAMNEVKIGITDDSHINAASGGGGAFYVTTGLLKKATDDQLVGVLAHELAHDDLNHVAKAQVLGAGLSIGMVILDQLIPGSGALTPIAGTLVANAYSRNEEYAADRHGAEILQKAGFRPSIMIDTLTWLMQSEGTDGGGFFGTHPATTDRIQALRDGR
jgi:Zn-dependent protease with chaperone function